jgi:hypothetical protein
MGTTIAGNWTINAGATVNMGDDVTVGGNTSIAGNLNTQGYDIGAGADITIESTGIFDDRRTLAPDETLITVSGNWTNNAGAGGFVCGNSTVTFTGTGTIKSGGAPFYNVTVNATSLDSIAHWLMNDTDGIHAVDSIDGHDGEGLYTPEPQGKINGALAFNGSDWVSMTPLSLGTSDLSVSAWVKYSDNVNWYRAIVGQSDSSWSTGFNVSIIRNGYGGGYENKICGWVAGGDSIIANTVTNDGLWHFVTVVKEGSSGKIYIDGTLQTSTASNWGSGNLTAPNPLYIGHDKDNGNFDGTIDDVRIYNTALNTTQIAQIYKSGSGTENEIGTYNLDGNLTVANNIKIDSGKLSAGANNINVGGDWTNNGGMFTPGTGTVTFNGATAQAIKGSATAQTFNNIVIDKAGQTLSVGGSTVTLNANNLTLTRGTFVAPATVDLTGTLTLTAGSYTAGANTYVAES